MARQNKQCAFKHTVLKHTNLSGYLLNSSVQNVSVEVKIACQYMLYVTRGANKCNYI